MFTLDVEALLVAGGIAFLFDFYVTWLLHLRYSRQFGVSFVLSGLVAFSLPCFIGVGFPVYCVLAAPVAPMLRLGLLTLLFVLLLLAGLRLKRKILSKIFPKNSPSHNSLA